MKKIYIITIISILLNMFIVSGSSILTSIEVEPNGMRILYQDNETNLSHDNFFYNGTTYVSIRKAAELFGEKVEWDENDPSVIRIGNTSERDDYVYNISLVNLLANLKDYENKTIIIKGYFTYGFEDTFLFLSPYDCEMFTDNRIYVDLPYSSQTNEYINLYGPLARSTVLIQGTIKRKGDVYKPHNDTFTRYYVTDVTRIEEWDISE